MRVSEIQALANLWQLAYPVYRSFVVLQVVVDRDTQSIAPSSIDCRPWVLPVYEEADLISTPCTVACAIGDVKVIADNLASAWEFLSMSLDSALLNDGVDKVKRNEPDRSRWRC